MGSIVDLALPGSPLPDLLVVDTNLVVAHLLTSFHTPDPQAATRAAGFFHGLHAGNAIGLVTSTSLAEIFHFAIKAKYTSEVPHHRSRLAASFPTKKRYDWLDLYKIDAAILQRFSQDLERLRGVLELNALHVIQPDELMPIASGRSFDEELVYLIGRYGLNSSDAAILLEAQRVEVFSIASLDRDMQRAQLDFDVYTWL